MERNINLDELVKTETIIDLLKVRVPQDKEQELIKKYKKDAESESKLDYKYHSILAGQATKLVKTMLVHGYWEDIDRALEYLDICINARACNLDVEKYVEDSPIIDFMFKWFKIKRYKVKLVG